MEEQNEGQDFYNNLQENRQNHSKGLIKNQIFNTETLLKNHIQQGVIEVLICDSSVKKKISNQDQ